MMPDMLIPHSHVKVYHEREFPHSLGSLKPVIEIPHDTG